jgi:hypothetical protein
MQSALTIKKKDASLECLVADQAKEWLRCTRQTVKLSSTSFAPLPFLIRLSIFLFFQ